MTASQILAGLASLTVMAGIALVMAGARRYEPRPGRTERQASHWRRRSTVRWVGAVIAGLAALALTRLPALGVAVAGAVLGLPAVLGGDSRASARIDRVEAVEEWSRRVADVLAIGVGLEQALMSAARTAPEAISDEAMTLAARVSARMPTEEALRRFADELDDPAADLVVAALILAVRRRGPGVAAALTAIAESVGDEVAARRRVEADRAKPRATARAVTLITMLIIGVGLLNRGYTAPYGTLLGQIVLAATLGFFAAALWWMHSMTVTKPPARILSPADGLQGVDR